MPIIAFRHYKSIKSMKCCVLCKDHSVYTSLPILSNDILCSRVTANIWCTVWNILNPIFFVFGMSTNHSDDGGVVIKGLYNYADSKGRAGKAMGIDSQGQRVLERTHGLLGPFNRLSFPQRRSQHKYMLGFFLLINCITNI